MHFFKGLEIKIMSLQQRLNEMKEENKELKNKVKKLWFKYGFKMVFVVLKYKCGLLVNKVKK